MISGKNNKIMFSRMNWTLLDNLFSSYGAFCPRFLTFWLQYDITRKKFGAPPGQPKFMDAAAAVFFFRRTAALVHYVPTKIVSKFDCV